MLPGSLATFCMECWCRRYQSTARPQPMPTPRTLTSHTKSSSRPLGRVEMLTFYMRSLLLRRSRARADSGGAKVSGGALAIALHAEIVPPRKATNESKR